MSSLQLSLTVNTVSVILNGKNGTAEEYHLREMDAASRDRYMDSLADRIRLDTSGKPAGVKRFEGMQADLLVHCLRKADGSSVRKEVIQSWPASVVSELFAQAQKINLLNQDVKEVMEESKND